jgi:four helix bundle protein
MKRAAVSIPANIAEGIGRNYKKDTVQFLHISRGSLYELQTLLCIAVMLEMISKEIFENISLLVGKNQQLINGLIRHYEQSDFK